MFKTMADGSIAYGDRDILNLFNDVIKNQMEIDRKAKFKPNEKVKINVSKDTLIKYIESTGETYHNARNEAILLLANDYGTIISKAICDEGNFYTIEFETMPMYLLPESFISKY